MFCRRICTATWNWPGKFRQTLFDYWKHGLASCRPASQTCSFISPQSQMLSSPLSVVAEAQAAVVGDLVGEERAQFSADKQIKVVQSDVHCATAIAQPQPQSERETDFERSFVVIGALADNSERQAQNSDDVQSAFRDWANRGSAERAARSRPNTTTQQSLAEEEKSTQAGGRLRWQKQQQQQLR